MSPTGFNIRISISLRARDFKIDFGITKKKGNLHRKQGLSFASVHKLNSSTLKSQWIRNSQWDIYWIFHLKTTIFPLCEICIYFSIIISLYAFLTITVKKVNKNRTLLFALMCVLCTIAFFFNQFLNSTSFKHFKHMYIYDIVKKYFFF